MMFPGLPDPTHHRVHRHRIAVLGVAVALSGVVGTTTGAQAAPGSREPDALQRSADAAVAAGAAGFLARVDDGRRIRTATAGLADREQGLRMKNSVRYEAGSQTKTFVAVLVLQLVQRGQVELDAPIEMYLPGVVPNGQEITVRMLLQHTSGLFNYTDDPRLIGELLTDPSAPVTDQHLLDVAFSHQPLFAPGTGWSYSNTGYIVLGQMLTAVTGRSVADLLHEQIAGPLHLHDTYLAVPFARLDRGTAHGYLLDFTTEPDTYVDTADWTLSWASSAGAVVSSARDLTRFYTKLLSGEVLPEDQLAQMQTTVDLPAEYGPGASYGLGLFRQETPCGTVWGHGGDTAGHHTTTVVSPDGERSTATDTNTRIGWAADDDPAPMNLLMAAGTAELTAVCRMNGSDLPDIAAMTAAQSLSPSSEAARTAWSPLPGRVPVASPGR